MYHQMIDQLLICRSWILFHHKLSQKTTPRKNVDWKKSFPWRLPTFNRFARRPHAWMYRRRGFFGEKRGQQSFQGDGLAGKRNDLFLVDFTGHPTKCGECYVIHLWFFQVRFGMSFLWPEDGAIFWGGHVGNVEWLKELPHWICCYPGAPFERHLCLCKSTATRPERLRNLPPLRRVGWFWVTQHHDRMCQNSACSKTP